MANKYQVVDEILKGQGQGTYNVVFTNLNITNEEDTESVEVMGAITDYVSEHLQVSYDNIEGAPALPVDTDEQSPAYQGESGAREIKGFHEVAFTGDYNDLSGAPGIPEAGFNNGVVKDFNSIAFTGITDLGNVQVSEILDLRSYSNGISTLGQDSAYISTLPSSLATEVAGFCSNFNLNKGKKPYYIITNAGQSGKVYQVLDVQIVGPGGPAGYHYYKIDVANVNISTYPYENGTKGDSVLENIEITSKLGCFIFDLVNNCIYYKSENINANIELSELADVATSGSYDDLDNKPNLDASSQNSDITGLADVATTGSYDDLEDTTCIINFSTFTYLYDDLNNSFTAITGTTYNNIYNLGLNTVYIENIDKIYNGNDENAISLKDAFLNLINEFNNYKKCIFITAYNQQIFIENISYSSSGQNLNHISIISIPIIGENYDALINENIYTKQQILNQYFYSLSRSILVCDFNTNTIYVRYHQFYPIMSSDYSMSTNSNNIIAVNISSKAGNQLQLLTNSGEEGLFV